MKPLKAFSMEQANDMLAQGRARRVELDFEITSDDFFRFAEYWCERGATISKKEKFIVKLKSFPPIPPYD
jgi:hypothetical protein